MSRLSRRGALGLLAVAPVAAQARGQRSFRDLAPRPPMGWNSWDSFAATINEEQARANAAVMAAKLLPHGYDVFTVDIQWYEPGATGFEYRTGVELAMDANGRLLPAPNRFPRPSGATGSSRLPIMRTGSGSSSAST